NVIFKNFLKPEFNGNIFPINIKSDKVLGVKGYKSIKDVPDTVDLAVIVIPARFVNSVVEECIEKKVKSCVVIPGGFSECGETERENEMRALVEKSTMRIIGPNCLGVFDTKSHVDTIFLPDEKMGRPPSGKISMISQSGAFVAAMLDWTAYEKIGMGKVISFGNMVDVNNADLLAYLSKDPETKVITMYMEGLKDGKQFLKAASDATKHKPVVILKSGRSKAGAMAASSHTGSLAGADTIYDAAFKQAGLIRTYSSEELFDIAKAFSYQELPKGNKVAIITDGGGAGVMATDACEDWGIELAEFDNKTKTKMKEKFPPYCSVKNPIDLTGDADADRFEVALNAVLEDENVDAILLIVLFQVPTLDESIVKRITEINKKSKKPIIVVSSGGEFTKRKIKELEEEDLPCYQTPERGVRALAAMYQYYQHIQKKTEK
ncbi:MAG: acetate--CoA ligase family protein, partial [Candidatus Methanofastidiosia archaeon]